MFAAREAMMVYMIKFMSFPMVFMVLASLLVLCYRLASFGGKDKCIHDDNTCNSKRNERQNEKGKPTYAMLHKKATK